MNWDHMIDPPRVDYDDDEAFDASCPGCGATLIVHCGCDDAPRVYSTAADRAELDAWIDASTARFEVAS